MTYRRRYCDRSCPVGADNQSRGRRDSGGGIDYVLQCREVAPPGMLSGKVDDALMYLWFAVSEGNDPAPAIAAPHAAIAELFA